MRIYIVVIITLLIAIFSNEGKAQTGCPCGIILKGVSSNHKATRAQFSNELTKLKTSVVEALKNQTRQLSAGQEKQLAALEALNDAGYEIERRVDNERLARSAAYDRAGTQSGCLAATSGTRLRQHDQVRKQTVDQVAAQLTYWNGGEGRADESSGSVARSIESQLQSNTGPPPTFGEILINAEDLDAENMNVLTRDVQLLTNPKPSPPIVLDDTNENAENYLRQQHESQVRSVVQQYFSDKAGRFGASYGVSEWYTAATGLSDPGPISLTKFLLSEAERRYTSLQWHGEQKHANLAIMMREQNTMLAFELFLRSHEFRQQERANDLLATQLSLELNK